MLYTTCVFLFGIYIGQEYNVPSINIIVHKIITYFNGNPNNNGWEFFIK